MQVLIKPAAEQFIRQKVDSGAFASAEEVVDAALAALMRQSEQPDQFAPGELDQMLAEADAEIERGDVIDGQEVIEEIRRVSAQRRAERSAQQLRGE